MVLLQADKNGQMTMWSKVLPFPIPAHKKRDIEICAEDGHVALAPILRRVKMGDALEYVAVAGLSKWSLEYVQVSTGHPHYRLYHVDLSVKYPYSKLIGIVDIMSRGQREVAMKTFCTYLWVLGFRPDNVELKVGGAITPEMAWKYHLPILFYASSGKREGKLLDE